MASAPSDWRERLAAYRREPMQAMRDALGSGGPARLVAVATLPLWLTPSLYHDHLRSAGTRPGRGALWAAAGLWVVVMNLMLTPAIPLVQAAVVRLGAALGYWDELFSAPATALVLTGMSCFLLTLLAALRWSVTWLACGLDGLFGSRTVSPPPFGFYAALTAGEISAVGTMMLALLFLAKPLNAPAWAWLQRAGPLQMMVLLGGSALLLGAMHLKTCAAESSAREIYGGRRKALAYEIGLPLAALLVLCWLAGGRA